MLCAYYVLAAGFAPLPNDSDGQSLRAPTAFDPYSVLAQMDHMGTTISTMGPAKLPRLHTAQKRLELEVQSGVKAGCWNGDQGWKHGAGSDWIPITEITWCWIGTKSSAQQTLGT